MPAGASTTPTVPEATRKAAFAALVKLQDDGMSVARSRAEVARATGLTLDEVRAAERDGLDAQWPPLGPDAG